MSANSELHRVNERTWMRGFRTMVQKENISWWSTRQWWLVGSLSLGLTVAITLVAMKVMPSLLAAAGATDAMSVTYRLQMGLQWFFEMDGLVLTIGMIILCHDLIVSEKQNGLAEWLLTKPLQRRSYLLAKMSASLVATLVLMIAVPSAAAYGVISLSSGELFPVQPFLASVAVMVLHTIFYLTLMLLLGTICNSRMAVLAIGIAILMGGNFVLFVFQPIAYVGPWVLLKLSTLISSNVAIPSNLLWSSIIATGIWCLLFTLTSLIKFERTEL